MECRGREGVAIDWVGGWMDGWWVGANGKRQTTHDVRHNKRGAALFPFVFVGYCICTGYYSAPHTHNPSSTARTTEVSNLTCVHDMVWLLNQGFVWSGGGLEGSIEGKGSSSSRAVGDLADSE